MEGTDPWLFLAPPTKHSPTIIKLFNRCCREAGSDNGTGLQYSKFVYLPVSPQIYRLFLPTLLPISEFFNISDVG
jgi:hypothetical protein